MRSIKHIALGAFLTLSVFFAVIYTSCSKDSCKGVTCLNKGTCSAGGVCKCPTGIGGTNCETIYRKLYANVYKGIATYNIIGADSNNTLTFNAKSDTVYTNMEVVWNDPGNPIVTLPIQITNSSSTGSNFVIVANTPVDTLLYNGSGSVNGTTASLTLTKTPIPPHIGNKIIVYFNDFNKQ